MNYDNDHRQNLEITSDAAALIDAGKSDSEIVLYLHLGEVLFLVE